MATVCQFFKVDKLKFYIFNLNFENFLITYIDKLLWKN